MKRLIRWLFGGDSLGFVPGWNQVRAEQASEATERLLLGACSQPRVELSAAQRARRRG